MSDIRNIIKEDRGLIKKFQAFLPGYKKYRNCEDLRTADNILRLELAKELGKVEGRIQDARDEASRNMDLSIINQLGELVNYSHTITEKVKHAEQGYAPWISGDVRIEENELQALYDYDLGLFHWMERLKDLSGDLLKNIQIGNPEKVALLRETKNVLQDFEETFDMRISKVSSVAQEK
jgi:hypothetical protein